MYVYIVICTYIVFIKKFKNNEQNKSYCICQINLKMPKYSKTVVPTLCHVWFIINKFGTLEPYANFYFWSNF